MRYYKIDDARKFFEDDPFLTNFFDSAIKSYEDSDNPLRLSNFACNIRELLREKMTLVSPDTTVLKCNWCKGDYIDGKGKPTRKARLRYYLLTNMNNQLLDTIFKEKITEIENDYKKKIDELSKFTHVTSKTFYISDEEIEKQFTEVIDLLTFIIEFVEASKKLTINMIEDFLNDDITNHIYNDYLDSELDVLSTHTSVDDVMIKEFSIEDITDDFIYIEGTAELDTCLQYGSYSEFHRGEGAAFNMSFDLDFSVKVNIADFDDKKYTYEPVNTDKFYGIEDGE